MKNSRIDRFHFITAVWGRQHTHAFVDVGLPSLLAAGNLPGIACRPRSRYQVFTKQSDLAFIESSAPFRRLRELIGVEIAIIEEQFEIAPHLMMSRCHRDGLRRAHELGAGAVFIPPECLWADGSMVNLERIAARGVPIVHMTGLRLVLDTVVPKLISDWRAPDGRSLQIAPRQLVKLGLQHLHPITKDLFFREQSEKLMPANLLWMVEDEGIAARCFHLHPLLVEPNERNAQFKSTIDDDLALVSDPSGSRDYVVSDSDEIFAFELSPLTHLVHANYDKGSVIDIASWAEVGMNRRHRMLVERPVRIHATDISKDKWHPIEKEAAGVVRKAMALVDKPTWYLMWKGYNKNLWHRSYAATLRRPTLPEPQPDAEAQPAPARPDPTQELEALFSALRARDIRGLLAWAGRRTARVAADGVSSSRRWWRTRARRAQQRVRHGWLMAGHLLLQLPYRLTPAFGELVKACYKVVELCFGLSPTVYPWHWRWSYEHQVLRPFLRSLDGSGGNALYIDGSGYFLGGQVSWQGVSISSLSDYSARNAWDADQFDVVAITISAQQLESLNLSGALCRLVRPGGQLFVALPVASTSACRTLVEGLAPGFRIHQTHALGSLGTGLLMRIFRLYRGVAVIDRTREQPSLLASTVRLCFLPLMFVTYPLVSLFAGAINACTGSGRLSTQLVVLAKTDEIGSAAIREDEGRWEPRLASIAN